MQILDLVDEPGHIPQLADWHHREWSALNPGATLEQRIECMQCYLAKGLVPSTFIAKGPSLMGSAAIIENDMDTRPELTPWLASVYVAPEFRNMGIGSRLVTHAMQKAKDAGIGKLYLFTPDRMSFYEKLGWRIFLVENYREHSVTVMHVLLTD